MLYAENCCGLLKATDFIYGAGAVPPGWEVEPEKYAKQIYPFCFCITDKYLEKICHHSQHCWQMIIVCGNLLFQLIVHLSSTLLTKREHPITFETYQIQVRNTYLFTTYKYQYQYKYHYQIPLQLQKNRRLCCKDGHCNGTGN